MIQLVNVYGKIYHACWAAVKWVFDENISKKLPLTTTYLNIICVNYNDNDIGK